MQKSDKSNMLIQWNQHQQYSPDHFQLFIIYSLSQNYLSTQKCHLN